MTDDSLPPVLQMASPAGNLLSLPTRLLPLGLAVLILAACGPVVYVTPGAGDVLPVEAQRVIDRATATAAVAATQAAQATATGISSRETATAARLATLDALAGHQTESALSLTQAAGYAVATSTSQASTRAAHETAAWATPTAAAIQAGATAKAAESARRLAQAENVGEFWRSLRFIVLALLLVGGLTVIAVVAFDRVTAVSIARLAQKAAIAREAFRVLAPGHWAEWQPGEGYQVYPLPVLLDEPATILENAVASPDRDHALKHAARLFAWWGDMFGFGIRDLGPTGGGGKGIVTDTAYRRLAKMFRGLGVIGDVVIDDQKKTGWLEGWGYARFADDLSHGRIALPPLGEDEEVPKVAFTVPTQHHS